MKYTLLDLVQTISSSMDGPEINSVNDTPESQQIAKIVRTVYFDIVDRASLPEQNLLFNLEATTDTTKPVLMMLPTNIASIDWIKYNKETTTDTDLNMDYVSPMPLEDFMNRMYQLKESDTSVGTFNHTVNGSTFTVLYQKDKAPESYTSFDDGTILFDSYDSSVEATLQKSKSLGKGRAIFEFTLSDSFIPPLDEPQHALLLNEAKALAWAELRQSQHPKAELSSRRGWVRLQTSKKAVRHLKSDFDNLPNFGRK